MLPLARRVGRDLFGMHAGPHRHGRVVQHLGGHRSEQKAAKCAQSAGGQHDQIHRVLARVVDNHRRRIAFRRFGLHRHAGKLAIDETFQRDLALLPQPVRADECGPCGRLRGSNAGRRQIDNMKHRQLGTKALYHGLNRRHNRGAARGKIDWE